MSTDFTYGGNQTVISGPIKPNGKDMPSDARTRVDCYADIASIPNPYVGLKITVKVDETNNNKMTDYIVKSLKANSIGVANTLIDEVVRYVDYLGASSGGGAGLTTEQAQHLQTAYLHSQTTHVQASDIPAKVSQLENDSNFATKTYTDNAISTALEGAIAEQAAQIQANKTAIGDSSSGLIKEVNDIKNTELQNLNTAILRVNETVGNKSELPAGDKNIIASINRIDVKNSTVVTDEQLATAISNYLAKNPITNENSKWKGKIASFIGDSITAGTGTTKKYYEYLQEMVGFSKCNGYGVGNSTISNKSGGMCTRYSNISEDSDIIFIFGGTNDYSNGVDIGEFYNIYDDVRTKNCDITTFTGGLNVLLNGLLTKFSDKQIVLLTPIHRNYYYGNNYNENVKNQYGYYLEDYVKKIKEAGEIYSIPVIDLYSRSGLYPKNSFNSELYFNVGTDELHPNALGHKRIANTIYADLKNISPNNITATSNTHGNIITDVSSLTVNKNGTVNLNVSLDTAPTVNQVVMVSVNNNTCKLGRYKDRLTFGPDNYSTAQSVPVTGLVDNSTSIITLSTIGSNDVTVNVTIGNGSGGGDTTVSVTSVSLNTQTLSINKGSTSALTATISPNTATNKNVTWSANNSNVTLTPNGLTCSVLGVTAGSSEITCTTEDGNKTATCTVTITDNSSSGSGGSSSSYAGKLFTATGTKENNYFFDAIVENPGLTKNDIVKFVINLSEGTNVKDGTPSSNMHYKSTNTVNDSTGNGVSGWSPCASTWVDGNLQASVEYTISRDLTNATGPYLQIPFRIVYSSKPFSFRINSLQVLINGIEQPIINLGGYYVEETFTLE